MAEDAIQNITDFSNESIKYSDVVTLMKLDPSIWKYEPVEQNKLEEQSGVKLKGKITQNKLRQMNDRAGNVDDFNQQSLTGSRVDQLLSDRKTSISKRSR